METRSTTAPSAPLTLDRRARPVDLFKTLAMASPGSIFEPSRGAPSESMDASGAFFSNAFAWDPPPALARRFLLGSSARLPNISPSFAAFAGIVTVSVFGKEKWLTSCVSRCMDNSHQR